MATDIRESCPFHRDAAGRYDVPESFSKRVAWSEAMTSRSDEVKRRAPAASTTSGDINS
jgi:hypothetical protein